METNNLYIWSIKNIKSNRISIHAAQVAFFIMVSFFPFLMFFITLLKHTPISEAVLLASVQKVIPASLSSLISTWLNESFEASTTILSATVISALWAGSKGLLVLPMNWKQYIVMDWINTVLFFQGVFIPS